MWFRGRATRNDAVIAVPSSASIDKADASNIKHPPPSTSRKSKRPLNSTREQKRQVSVTPVDHPAIIRERQRLHDARQKQRPHHKGKPKGSSYRSKRTIASRLVSVLFFAIGFGLPFLLFLYDSHPDTDKASKRLRNPQNSDSRNVYFIQAGKHMDDKDLFSASWLQPISSFLKFDTSGKNLATTQAGSNALFQSNREKVKMTLDWLDFSVEHLSSWMEATETFKSDDNVAFHVILSKLYEYIKSVSIHESDTSMIDTISVIAFEPWTSRTKPNVANQLSVASLAATIASLIQAGFGRVVVVGYNVQDEEYAEESFRLLLSLISNKDTSVKTTTAKQSFAKIERTELAYVRAATEDVISQKTPINIVKGALTGLQKALTRQSMSTERQYEWLGTARNASSWKYVYLTEPDSILQTRPSSLPFLKEALDQGMILAPHRLQALPHEYDLAGMKNTHKRVPNFGNFSTIQQLNPWKGAVCCDEYSKSHKPWKQYPKCNSHWWQCGFNDQQDHSRLEHYHLIRLTNPGMNLVTLAANHNGRRCITSNSGVCIPPDVRKTET